MTKGKFDLRRLMGGGLVLTVAMIVFVSWPALCEGVDPNEVIIYEHANFGGTAQSFRLEAGMRQRLVPYIGDTMNDKTSSIEVGSNVAVEVFEHADFRDKYDILGNPGPCIYDTSQGVLPDNMNDNISSLIVFPKELKGPMGVTLKDAHEHFFTYDTYYYYQFFPLPEWLSETVGNYPTLGPMDDDANILQLEPSHWDSPARGKVDATLYENPNYSGRQMTFYASDANTWGYFKMSDYNFDDSASSLIVRWNPNAQKPVDPYEVVVYEHYDYITEQPAAVSYKLELGMRQKLVPYVGDALNDQLSSIRVGANVGVALFRHVDFGGGYETYFSSQNALPNSINDQVSSLIVFPKQLLQPIGATLVDARWDGENHWFYPAAEYLGEFLTSYPVIDEMNDDANRVVFTPTDPQSPAYHKISVSLFEHANYQGRSVILPGADEWIPNDSTFYMNWYNFDDSASSLSVSWRGGMLSGPMSPPSPNYIIIAEYTAIPTPLQRMYPLQAMPVGIGSVAQGGNTLNISVHADFNGPVDIYLGLHNPLVSPDIFLLRPDYSLQALSAGFVPWKTNTTGSVNESLFGDIPALALLPDLGGPYTVYFVVAPAGNLSGFYLWQTSFFIGYPVQ